MTMLEDLSHRIESDVRGSQEAAVEKQVKEALTELKNQFKYTDSYLSTLYDKNFSKYLKSKTFNSPKKLNYEIVVINNIKQNLIKQWIVAKGLDVTEKSLDEIKKAIYWVCWISQKLSNNNEVGNLIKWVIDEIMAYPDMCIQILKDIFAFAKSLWQMIKSPDDLLKQIGQAYWDVFTQWLNSPEAQYRTWRSAALLVLTFIPWWMGKSLLNVGRWIIKQTWKNISMQPIKQVWKTVLKNGLSQTAKSVAKQTWKVIVKESPKLAMKTAKKWIWEVRNQAISQAASPTKLPPEALQNGPVV